MGNDILLYENPRRRRRRRNQLSKLPGGNVLSKALPGIGLNDIIAATGGLAAATIIPPLVVRDISTVGRKLGRFAVALLSGTVVSMVAGSVKLPAKSAMIGAIAGAGTSALAMFTPLQLAGSNTISGRRGVGSSQAISPATSRDAEVVSVIEP